MAKKSRRNSGFNLSGEVRDLLSDNPQLKGKEALAALKQKYPKQSINENSFGVAYSMARKKLGLSKGRKVKRRKPGHTRSANGQVTVDLQALQSARKLLEAVGDADTAIAAIKQVQALQLS